MKKTAIFGFAALMLGAVACDKIEDSNALPESNPQLPIVEATSAKVTPAPGLASLIDLTVYGEQQKMVEVATVAAEEWPEGFVPDVPFMEVSATQDFAHSVEVGTTTDADGKVYVDPSVWEEAYVNLFGQSPYTNKNYIRFAVYAVNGEQKVRMGGIDTWYGVTAAEVVRLSDVLFTPGVANGDTFGNDNMVLICTNDKEGEDKIYQGFIYVKDSFRLCPTKNIADALGVDASGKLAVGGNPITVPVNGLYFVDVNYTQKTYTATEITSIGAIGGFNGWGGDENLVKANNEGTVWEGDVTFGAGDEWKIRMNGGWDINLGGSLENLSVGAGNLVQPVAGTFKVTLSFATIPYHATLTAK